MAFWKAALVMGALLLAPLQVEAGDSAEFKIWAMEAHAEGRDAPHFDPGLDEVKDAVKSLKFDTYLKLKTDEHTFTDDQEYRAAINEQYTLSASPPVPTKDGRYRMKITITMPSTKTPGTEINALTTELLLQPGKKVLVKGLKLGEGKEMVVVLSLAAPESKSGDTPQN
ncbi:MAG: hypothetical protein JNK74_02955 [Candidatus Hydrogenedentes bacterium]|nr:hypothetical protein [Candidatus Hydrogenedentota bacterium]